MFIDDLLRLLSTPRAKPIFVCELERAIYIRMGAHLGHVYLSKETVIKQARRHPDIKSEEYRMLPDAIRDGLVVHDLKQPNKVIICYEATPGQRFRVTLKTVGRGDEIFVVSHHRMALRRTKALFRRGYILRRHK